jgi:hypothetical protein
MDESLMHCGSSSDDKYVRSAAKRGSRTWMRRRDDVQMGSGVTYGVDRNPSSLHSNDRHECTGDKASCRSCRHENIGHGVTVGV